MAKIVESLTRAEPEYSQKNIQSLVRDLDSVITKLNSTFQETLIRVVMDQGQEELMLPDRDQEEDTMKVIVVLNQTLLFK